VFAWIEGDHPAPDRLADPHRLARDLAELIHAFHRVDLPDPPAVYRGPVSEADAEVRRYIAQLADEFDPRALTEVWEPSFAAAAWSRAAGLGPRRPAFEQPPDPRRAAFCGDRSRRSGYR
jgi:hypothetical protein